MAVQLVDNFDLSSKKPLDSRAYWETLEALQANKTILMPNGFLAYVEDKKCYYIMSCTNPADPSTYTWSEFKAGGSSSTIDLSNYYTKSQVDALIKQLQQSITSGGTSQGGTTSGGATSSTIINAISADDINNKYADNSLDDITTSNIESWIDKYIYSSSDRFNNSITCGTKVTIQDGTYNAQWVVVGADTELNKGDTKLTKPHLSLIPVTNLGGAKMNTSNITTNAYVGSKMYKETIPAIVEALQKVLGNHLLARRVRLANSTDGSNSNGSAYYTVYANLLCERQIWGESTYENSYDIGDDITALPGFSNYKNNIYGSSGFGLRSVCNSLAFVIARGDGGAGYDIASYSNGVRPLITIG